MKQNQESTINQVQKLVFTPNLQQSLSILQMPLGELETYLSRQLLENFLLEQDEGYLDEDFSETPINSLEDNETGEKEIQPEEDFWLENDQPEQLSGVNSSSSDKSYDNPNSATTSLQEHLFSQLHLINLPEIETVIAEFLIGNIDDDGYLQCEARETAKFFSVTIEVIENLLHLIQTFEPPGVGARNIRECLLLQLRLKREYANGEVRFSKEMIDLTKTIIDDHLHDLADGKLSKISNQLKSSLREIQAAVDLIKSLDPKPGRNFVQHNELPYVIPDVIIKKEGTGYIILVNETDYTHLTLNPLYRKLRSAHDNVDQAAVNFIKEKYHSAVWLIKCIEQRRLTLYKIADSLLKLNLDFFERGPLFVKPLTLRDLAAATGLHESTVSRATAAKFIDTPRGVYSFKYFFSSKLDSADGSPMSAKTVKGLIKKAILSESTAAPLSDQQLTIFLQKEHQIRISRRTVAKYREEMLIPASGKRKTI